MTLRYCTRCLYPSSKPDLSFRADGVCSACDAFEQRKDVDWQARKAEFIALTDRYRGRGTYDCIVPVSGGKDSTYQVVTLLEHGLNPLCVTAATDDLSDIGRRNLDNIGRLGVDHIEVKLNPKVRRKINRFALCEVGDISWPEHVSIFTVPVRIACKFKVPLIVWGENAQNEYGGPAAAQGNNTLTRAWLEEFGGLLGLRVADLEDAGIATECDLIQYRYPSDEDLAASGVTGLFLGHYFPWDGMQNALIAQAHGFETWPHAVEGSLANYENLDNHQTGIHDYFKWLKFGFGRATDIACSHIRRGRITRATGLAMVKRHDGAFPETCLGKRLDDVLAAIGMVRPEFMEVCHRFANKALFTFGMDGWPRPSFEVH